MKPKWIYLLAVVVLLLASCATPAEPTSAPAGPTEAPPEVTEAPLEVTEAPPAEATEPPAAEETAPPAEGGTGLATFIFTQEFDSLNPYYTNMWFSAITHQLWNCWAWDFDDQNDARPVLVTEIPSVENGGISEDGTVITLTLRDDLVWSDGEPLTANDFVFTYQMIIDPGNTVASTNPYDQMASVEAPDDRTVVITFNEPYAPWLGTLWHGLLPAHILQPIFDEEGTIDNAEWNRAPTVGCGPYNLTEWESGSFTSFVANQNYWLGQPKINEIFIRFVPDDASQIAAMQAGDGDLGTFFAYSDVPSLEAAEIEVLRVFSGYNEGWYFYLDPENGHPALQDPNVRKALAMAFDRFSLNQDLLLGLTEPASTYWDNTPYNDPSLEAYPYDLEEANRLLDEAGWVDTNGDGVRDKDGVELSLTYGSTTREVRVDTQAVAQQQLAEAGVQVELLNYDSDIFFSGYGDGGPAATGELDIYQYSTVTNFPDPDTAEWLCSEIPSDDNPQGTNWMAFCDEMLDSLFMAQATQVDPDEREATFHEITRYIFDNALWIGVWQDPDLWGISGRLQNVRISGATPFFNIMEWEITP
jgi:peptide/nickel transport system substrate-binding protein